MQTNTFVSIFCCAICEYSNRTNKTSEHSERGEREREIKIIFMDSKSRMKNHLTKNTNTSTICSLPKSTLHCLPWFFNHKFCSETQLLQNCLRIRIKFHIDDGSLPSGHLKFVNHVHFRNFQLFSIINFKNSDDLASAIKSYIRLALTSICKCWTFLIWINVGSGISWMFCKNRW